MTNNNIIRKGKQFYFSMILKDTSVLTMNCWEDAFDQILIKVLVFAHLVDFLPLLVCHLFFNCLCSDIITIKIFATKL